MSSTTQVYGWTWMTMTAVKPQRNPAPEFHAAHRTCKSPAPSPVGIPDWLGLGLAEEERIIAVQKSGRLLLQVAHHNNAEMGLFVKIHLQGLTPLGPL